MILFLFINHFNQKRDRLVNIDSAEILNMRGQMVVEWLKARTLESDAMDSNLSLASAPQCPSL